MRVLQCREGANAAIPEAQQTSCECRYVIIMTFPEPMALSRQEMPRDAKDREQWETGNEHAFT